MLTTQKKQKGSTSLVEKWLQQRQAFIVVLSQLCNLRPFSEVAQAQLWTTVQEFCQIMVDYLSLGHFEVYECLISPVERANIELPRRLLQTLMNNTIDVLDFNDKYQIGDLSNLDKDLSKLAFHLAQRFEWEDELLSSYYATKHHDKPIARTA